MWSMYWSFFRLELPHNAERCISLWHCVWTGHHSSFFKVTKIVVCIVRLQKTGVLILWSKLLNVLERITTFCATKVTKRKLRPFSAKKKQQWPSWELRLESWVLDWSPVLSGRELSPDQLHIHLSFLHASSQQLIFLFVRNFEIWGWWRFFKKSRRLTNLTSLIVSQKTIQSSTANAYMGTGEKLFHTFLHFKSISENDAFLPKIC